MNRTLLVGGCSFTFGHELSDDQNGKKPSSKTWSALLANEVQANYFSFLTILPIFILKIFKKVIIAYHNIYDYLI
jgi:hypothetical protein